MSDRRVGAVIDGKWQIDGRLGSGGMATVYSVVHRNGHRAALKLLFGALSRDASVRARFLREGYVANAVGHPGVVKVIDDGITDDGIAFLVLELLEGETIDARRQRRGGTLPIDDVLEFTDQALDALAAAHEKGIVHRDVKPENIFVTSEGRIKLLDFGLAQMRSVIAEETRTGVKIGTPEFMPPEQAAARRDAIDARSDVWGVGATMFTLITGRFVHDDAQSLHEQLVASATRRSRPIRQLAPHVMPALANVVDRALELEPADRWPSAREMQLALREARGPGSTLTSDSTTAPSFFFEDKTKLKVPAEPPPPPLPPSSAPRPALDPPAPRAPPDPSDLEATFVENKRPREPFRGQLKTLPHTSDVPSALELAQHVMLRPDDRTELMHPRDEAPRSFPKPPQTTVPLSTPQLPRPPESVDPVSAPQPIARVATGTALVPVARRQASASRGVLVVALVMLVMCAAMGAYVLWHSG